MGCKWREKIKKIRKILKKHDAIAKILYLGVEVLIHMIHNGNFRWFSAKFGYSYNNLEIYRKKLVGLKKKSWKKIGPNQILWPNFWIFFRKKIGIFSKNFFFESCSFDAKTSAKKNFFLKKITTQISTKISIFILAMASCYFKIFRNFLIFSRNLHPKERF